MLAMRSRILLPASIAAFVISGFSLVFCHKSEDEAVKKTPVASNRLSAPKDPLASRKVEISAPVTERKPSIKDDTEKVLTPEEEEKEAKSKASTLYKWLAAYSLDNGGAFPSDTSALMSANLGFPTDQAGDWLRHVLGYRGRGLTSSDNGSLVLLRYRIGTRTDREVRVYVSGRTIAVPADEAIPEDALLTGEAPR